MKIEDYFDSSVTADASPSKRSTASRGAKGMADGPKIWTRAQSTPCEQAGRAPAARGPTAAASAARHLLAGHLRLRHSFLLWCALSYLPFLWHPLVLIQRSGRHHAARHLPYRRGQLVENERVRGRNPGARARGQEARARRAP